jgi:UDP-2-acetamido-3-amino-2,3-dideoxy-glucuronate N-acetyltransferase
VSPASRRGRPLARGGGTHESAVVDPGARLGPGVRIWHFCHVMAAARIGAETMLGQGCFVGAGVVIGARVRLQNHVSVFEGVELEDDVFVGPGAVFTNVRTPRAFVSRRSSASGAPGFERTVVRRGATIGANATVVCGTELGEYCLVGAGAVVTKDVPSYALVAGVPARRIGWVSRHGEVLRFRAGRARCPATGESYALRNGAVTPAAGKPAAKKRARQRPPKSSR